MRRFLQWLQPTGAYAWRWLGGMPPDDVRRPEDVPRSGDAPRTDAGSLPPGHRTPPRGATPPLPSHLVSELCWDLREIRAEWHALRVRQALGRELREVERQVLAEHETGEL